MSTLDTAKKAIEKEFEIFSKKFDGYFSSENELLSAVNNYILQKKGKQIRPIMALLAAKCLGDVNDSSYDGATAIEMLHTASLIHDDMKLIHVVGRNPLTMYGRTKCLFWLVIIFFHKH